jgi:hypothetical protein
MLQEIHPGENVIQKRWAVLRGYACFRDREKVFLLYFCFRSSRTQGLIEVRDDILHRFDANGEPQHVFGYAQPYPVFR